MSTLDTIILVIVKLLGAALLATTLTLGIAYVGWMLFREIVGWPKIWAAIRQYSCTHRASTANLVRRADGRVECPCNRCGKILVADYGLALPVKWEAKP